METSSIVKGKVFCCPNEGDFLKLCHYYYDWENSELDKWTFKEADSVVFSNLISYKSRDTSNAMTL